MAQQGAIMPGSAAFHGGVWRDWTHKPPSPRHRGRRRYQIPNRST